MKAEKQNEIRKQKSQVERLPLVLGRSGARTPRKHHEQPIILPAVMPWTQRQVQRENPGQRIHIKMRQHQCQQHQPSDMNGEYAITAEVVGTPISAVQRGHVVRIIEEKGETIKTNGPRHRRRIRREIAEKQKRNRPRSAANHKVQPAVIDPGSSSRRLWRLVTHEGSKKSSFCADYKSRNQQTSHDRSNEPAPSRIDVRSSNTLFTMKE